MNQYLLDILNDKKRVIIPNLGAFISKEDQTKKVVFNEFLKYNDGVLINYIIEKEGISEQDAERKVMNFSKRVSADLNADKKVDFTGLGVLVKDKSGKVKLEESVDSETAPQQVKQEQVQDKKDEEDKKQESEQKTEQEQVKTPLHDEVPKITQKEQTVKAQQQGETKKTEPKLRTYSTSSVITSIPTSTTQSKKRTGVIWITIVAVAVLAIVSWIFFFSPGGFGGLFKKEIVVEEPPTIPVADSIDIADTLMVSEDTMPVEPVVPEKQYYIVAGCFQYENNADNYVTVLKENGYDARKFGKYNSLYAVSFESFPTLQDAKQTLIHIRRNVEPRAWILYY